MTSFWSVCGLKQLFLEQAVAEAVPRSSLANKTWSSVSNSTLVLSLDPWHLTLIPYALLHPQLLVLGLRLGV